MEPVRQLSLFDTICIMVGIIIGTGIYGSTPDVASSMRGVNATLAIWVVGGILSLAGALCYAELATAYPRAGGDYVYLTRAFGRLCGALFGWSQLAIVRPGNIAAMAFIFAQYANKLWAPFGPGESPWAAIIIVVLTVLNIVGVRSGRTTQNVLTVAKVASLLAIIGAALWGGAAPLAAATTPATGPADWNVELALILVLFTYGGWNEMSYVAAEVKDPRRNIVRSLVIGTLLVTVLYVLVNAAFFFGLGYEGTSKSKAVAVDAVARAWPASAGRVIAAMICISAAGAVNGMIFTGARISYALGAEHALFGVIGRWHGRLGTPAAALAVQGAISLGVMLAAGSFVDTIAQITPAVWLFFSGTGLALFVLRYRERGTQRPFKVPGYPVVPLVFLASSVFLVYSGVVYAWGHQRSAFYIVTGVLLAGFPVYWVSRWMERRGIGERGPKAVKDQ